MITKQEYEQAVKVNKESQGVINQYFRDRAFKAKMDNNPVFTDDELTYAADARCPCGAGLAYPKDAGGDQYWDCSDILKGMTDNTDGHSCQLSSMFWSIESENQPSVNGVTTRPK